MSLTGITWLTGEVIDADRLNTMVNNTSYTKSLFTTGATWSGASFGDLGWLDVEPWVTGQIIDSIRLNQMYTNQNVLKSLISNGVTVWNDASRYDGDQFFDWDYGFGGPTDGKHGYQFYLTIDGERVGPVFELPRYATATGGLGGDETSGNYGSTNIDISMYSDSQILTIGLWFGLQLTNQIKVVKYPNMRYLSYSVTLGTHWFHVPVGDHSIPEYYWRDDLIVSMHDSPRGW